MDKELIDFFLNIFEHFIDPKKRIFLGYILISLLIAFIWLIYVRKLSPTNALRKIFDKRIFFSKSSRSDYSVFFLNRIFTLFISPMLITQIVIATLIYHFLHKLTWINFSSRCVSDTHYEHSSKSRLNIFRSNRVSTF